MDFVQRQRVPYWLTYLVLLIAEIGILHILAWADGWVSPYTFNPLMATFPVWLWVPMAIMTYVDSVSLQALSSFRSLLDITEEQFNGLNYEFTNMPSRGVFFSGLVWSVNYLLINYLGFDATYAALGWGKIFAVLTFTVGLVTFLTGSAIYYHSLQKLVLINRTVKMVKQFNLFRLDPVYAFSRVTSLIGISWMLMLTLTLLTLPIQLATEMGVALMAIQIILAIAAFVLPLWFVHRRLVSEKRGLIAELNLRVQAAMDNLHHALDNSEKDDVDHFSNALMGLGAEREVLAEIPTWPWRAGTLTGFLSAIVLPIVLFLIQFVIQKWLEG